MTAHEYGTADGTPPPGVPGTPSGPGPGYGSSVPANSGPAPGSWPYGDATGTTAGTAGGYPAGATTGTTAGWPYDGAGDVRIPAQKTADAVHGAVPADTTGADSTGATGGADPAGAEKKPAVPGRDRYLDLLRSIALVRVVAYHLFGWAWLSVLFPSMGVMFALAGSLMARSLNRPALSVIKSRVRRLLPPLWVFSALMLGILFVQGWSPAKDPDLGGHLWGPISVFNYLVPIGAPPYPLSIGSESGLLESSWADQAAGPLWYLRAYLWFVLASPLLLWAFRRVPWATLLFPLALTAVVGTGLVTIPGETGNAVQDFAVYGSCWVLGFAHNNGMLKQIPRYAAVSGAAALMAFGLWWASGHLGSEGWDLNDIPLAQATWSFGIVVILLQYSPSWQTLPGRLAKWDKLITLSNNRAVTIYLWHNLLIMATVPILDLAYDLPFMQSDAASSWLDSTELFWQFVLVWPLIGLAILSVGWVEDLAAKRKPRLWPNGAKKKRAARAH
ncbi:acyltransferase [Streptomyces sp. 6-11-2]|uniref:acyltransferase family protein n=1 Tax=Streptomyces sp. 6-11-2 TaxID=2585753 RepID=UPI00116FCF48|nr:acyltransferase [Streptomyces sp. 6-11-2]GED86710.1 membrane protein [Streptomyces sp. 6-11-2]